MEAIWPQCLTRPEESGRKSAPDASARPGPVPGAPRSICTPAQGPSPLFSRGLLECSQTRVSPENAGSRAVPSGSPDAAVPPSRLAEKGEEPLGGRGSGSIFLAGRSLLGPWTRGRASVRQDSDIFNSRVSVFLPGDQLTERKGPAGPDQWQTPPSWEENASAAGPHTGGAGHSSIFTPVWYPVPGALFRKGLH